MTSMSLYAMNTLTAKLMFALTLPELAAVFITTTAFVTSTPTQRTALAMFLVVLEILIAHLHVESHQTPWMIQKHSVKCTM